MSALPRRPCYACEQFDDHPRHEMVGDPEFSMHMDCCAEQRGCVICRVQIQRATDAAGVSHGTALGEALMELPPLAITHVPNDDDSDPHNLRTVEISEA